MDYLLTSNRKGQGVNVHALGDDWLDRVIYSKQYKVAQYLLMERQIDLTPEIIQLSQDDEEVSKIIRQRTHQKLESTMVKKDYVLARNKV